MSIALFSILTLLLLSLESVLVKMFAFEFVRIDVVLCIIVFVCLRSTLLTGAIVSFMVGYLLDVFSGQPTWLEPGVAMTLFVVFRLVSTSFHSRGRLGFALFCIAATSLHALLVAILTWITHVGSAQSLAFLPLQVLVTTIAGQLLWFILRRIESGETGDTASAKRSLP
jgi:hypothetical protein